MNTLKSARAQGGFTLLEMLAVIVLLGIVATIVVRQVGGNVDKGKYGAGKAQLASLSMKVESYALDVGAPPRSLDQLTTRPASARNWNGPYAKPSDLRDPFGHDFGYRAPGQHGPFDLVFYGQDGQPGGEGFNADLGNWE
ncbi:type II secretion system major pseudopilin GspG [Pseudomonas sp.]|uniref:type II secretion system major pseudopilin GspG n=1 Tax=Pseudomonas sp. TaxID=306 RepID=UPI001303665E|nr:type II secretion system major pseudopilin GspG [Pseudomonas sp.]